MSDSTPGKTLVQKAMAEPTMHFFVIAVLIFALSALARIGDENVLEVDQREIDARIFMQEMATGEALTDEQREFVTASYIEEQILVQEALAMGLDNDARIHDMLAQKMRHVLSGGIIQPSEEELESFYQRNLERYRSLPALDVMELVVNSREQLAADALEQFEQGASASSILERVDGSSGPLPNVNPLDLANIFSQELSEQAFAATEGNWVGPFISNRGQHWLQILTIKPSRLPPLEEIRDQVRLEWIAQEEDIRLGEQIAELWNKYSIIISEGESSEE